jgi:hypothetical protein
MVRRNRLHLAELLEPRQLLTVTINATEGPDTISVEYIFDLINHWRVIINGGTQHHFLDGNLQVNGLGGDDDIEIRRTHDNFCTVNGGAGDDTITVGGGNFDNLFQATINVGGSTGDNTLVIFDERETGTPAGLEPGLGPLFGKMIYDNRVFENTSLIAEPTIDHFVLRGTSGGGNPVVRVGANPAVASVRIEGMGGDDRANFFRDGSVATTFEFVGGSGTDRLEYFQVSGVNRFTVTGNALTATTGGQVLAEWSETQRIDIDSNNDGSDFFIVNEVNTGVTVSVSGTSGDDSYTIGGNDIDANIRGPLSVIESSSSTGGIDSVLFNDGGSTPDEYTLDLLSFTKTGLANPITFRAESRGMNANSGDNLITVVPDPNGTATNVAAGNGQNTLIYGSGDIRGSTNAQFIGFTSIIFDDTGPNPAGVTDKDYTLDATGMQYFVNGTIDTTFLFQGASSLNLLAGAYASTFTVNQITNLPSLQINGGDGTDSFVVNNYTGATSTLDFVGEGGTDSITFNYAADTTQSYTVNTSTFLRTGLGQVNWSAEQLALTAGSSGNLIRVNGIPVGTSVSVDGRGGDDSLHIGAGDVDAQVNGAVAFTDGPGTDRIIVFDDANAGADNYSLAPGSFDKAGDFGPVTFAFVENFELRATTGGNIFTMNPGTSMNGLFLFGTAGNDTFNVTPSNASISIVADSTTFLPGDALTFVNAASAGNATLTPSSASDGTYTFASAGQLQFSSVETFPTPPAPPSVPDLIAADDTGISDTDNITKKLAVTFTGTGTAGRTILIQNGNTILGSATAAAGGTYSIAATLAANVAINVTAATRDPASGLTGPASAPLPVTTDTVAPSAPGSTPHLNGASDTGVSGIDGITSDNTPTFDGLAPAGTIVRLFANSTEVGLDTEITSGFYAVTTGTLSDGVKTMTTRFEDVAGNQSTASPSSSVTIDTVAPTLTTREFRFATAPHALAYTFSENVGPTIDPADFVVTRLPATNVVTAVSFNAGTRTATVTFPVNGVLPDGRYTSQLSAAGVTDIAGNVLAAGDTLNFLFMLGDANNNGSVNIQDFNILASNFGQTGRNFTQGDFNYDGTVNIQDFNILAGRFGQSVAPAASVGDPNRSRVIDDLLI